MTKANVLLLILLAAGAGDLKGSPGKPTELIGKWVLDKDGKAIAPEFFRRGLQPSALAWRAGELWSLGDQRSQYPGHLFRIDPRTGRLHGAPLELELPAPRNGENPAFDTYRLIPNSDFEGLTVHPRDPDILFAVTEDKVPWVVEIHLRSGGPGGPTSAAIVQLSEIKFPEQLAPWRFKSNFRMEGLAVSDDCRVLYLAFERAEDELPRIFSAPLETARAGKPFHLKEVNVRFGDVPPRSDKEGAQLNINDIQFLRRGNRALLLAIARDQERLLVIDLEEGKITRTLDLHFRDAEGQPIYWVSPEGLAFDETSNRLWIVNDPDSVRGNYRRRDEPEATKLYAAYVPLLFEMQLSTALGKER